MIGDKQEAGGTLGLIIDDWWNRRSSAAAKAWPVPRGPFVFPSASSAVEQPYLERQWHVAGGS
jgi:hypothetical protein